MFTVQSRFDGDPISHLTPIFRVRRFVVFAITLRLSASAECCLVHAIISECVRARAMRVQTNTTTQLQPSSQVKNEKEKKKKQRKTKRNEKWKLCAMNVQLNYDRLNYLPWITMKIRAPFVHCIVHDFFVKTNERRRANTKRPRNAKLLFFTQPNVRCLFSTRASQIVAAHARRLLTANERCFFLSHSLHQNKSNERLCIL